MRGLPARREHPRSASSTSSRSSTAPTSGRRPVSRSTTREIDGTAHPSIVVPVPSRLTIPLPLPRHGMLRAFASLEPSRGGCASGAGPAARWRQRRSHLRAIDRRGPLTADRRWTRCRAISRLTQGGSGASSITPIASCGAWCWPLTRSAACQLARRGVLQRL